MNDAFVGHWDMLQATRTTLLKLEPGGVFVNITTRVNGENWYCAGQWSVQDRGGATWLILTVQSGYPRTIQGSDGASVPAWPELMGLHVLDIAPGFIACAGTALRHHVEPQTVHPTGPGPTATEPASTPIATQPAMTEADLDKLERDSHADIQQRWRDAMTSGTQKFIAANFGRHG